MTNKHLLGVEEVRKRAIARYQEETKRRKEVKYPLHILGVLLFLNLALLIVIMFYMVHIRDAALIDSFKEYIGVKR